MAISYTFTVGMAYIYNLYFNHTICRYTNQQIVEKRNKNVIINVLPPRNWKQKGGEPIGNILIIFALHCGKCNSLLHMQLVRWGRVVGN